MATIFSRIIAGEIPSYKIAEDDRFFAFLDINPMAKGHTLVVPKQEIDYIFDLDDSLLAGMALFAKKVA
ncbi:MAG TPA: HIT family protein, partial [Porphyromonadaceae bacterium]|nr:HIT family protein [Porphyromonadaceae bacterium]